jgi:hypothetical protein
MPDTKGWLRRPPGYELFFAPLQATLTPTDQEMLHFAYIASKYGHAGQMRDGGTRYFDQRGGFFFSYFLTKQGRLI